MKKKEVDPLDIYGEIKAPEFFSSGCLLLDKALGGGWVENRVINIIGENSSGKSLLSIQACKQYHLKHPDSPIFYVEAEQAFDIGFAESIGFPTEHVHFVSNLDTVEGLFSLLSTISGEAKGSLVIVDSLDALSTEEEIDEETTSGYAGARKAAQMSALFRKLNAKMAHSKMTLIIVSQTRENIGVVFGRKWRRAGGKALDFYASHRIVLSPGGRLTKTISGEKRVLGTVSIALIDKNKCGPSFRKIELPLLFYGGLDNRGACFRWWKGIKGKAPELTDSTEKVLEMTESKWEELEQEFKKTSLEGDIEETTE